MRKDTKAKTHQENHVGKRQPNGPGRSEMARIRVPMNADLLERLDQTRQRLGISRSEMVARALRVMLVRSGEEA